MSTRRVISVSLPVADQDAALRFYTEGLGFELRHDLEAWPGARLVEVVPPGSEVGIMLLPHDSQIPVAVRMATEDAAAMHARLRDSGATLHNEEPIELDGGPPMFFFSDPDGNGLVYIQE
jgi:catechol 2,3-dioxygenase-like lactoylglutathione lyase family enzyme